MRPQTDSQCPKIENYETRKNVGENGPLVTQMVLPLAIAKHHFAECRFPLSLFSVPMAFYAYQEFPVD